MRRQDPDLKNMSVGALRREVDKMRRAIRKHRDAKDNARCWHNDLRLYSVLPEEKPAGRMDIPEDVLLRNCKAFIRRQKCDPAKCSHAKART